ncbi:MAG: hypothetical protein D6737_07450 [Chloroflexi bacterium]|nr:MAG: hypothetical protein D6737_07450 [Chloroflexota bacterium]
MRNIYRSIVIVIALFSGIASTQAQPTIIEQMTLEQRVAQMFMVSLFGPEPTVVGQDFLRRWQPGGVILFEYNSGNPSAITNLTNTFQQTMRDVDGIPLLIAVDQEGGVVARLRDGFTAFPSPIVLGASGDTQLSYEVGAAMAQELRAVGVAMNLAPVADLETNPDNPIIVRRSFGSDPAMISPVVSNMVLGMQDNGVLATVKHFPGHGESTLDSHLGLPVVDLDRQRLETVELAPFREAILAGAEAVMVAHIWYPSLEPEPNLPATLSHNIVTGLLREELGFDGLIITDALDMDAIDLAFTTQDAAVRAVEAGVDLIALGPHVGLLTQEQSIQAVVDAVRDGRISEARINESVRRIFDAKARFGVLDWQPLDTESAAQRVDVAGHESLIEDVFAASVTVAYDTYDLIPVPEERSTALIYPATRLQIWRECEPFSMNLTPVGVSNFPTDEEIAWAVTTAFNAETVIVFTQNAINNARQQALVNALPPEKTVVVALQSSYDWTTFPDVAAFMTTYSPLRPAGPAACAVLFGAAPAPGRLPLSLGPTLPVGSRDE